MVLRWQAKQNRDAIFTTTITQAAILYGIEMLPAGKRRERTGRPISQFDALIVSVCALVERLSPHGMRLTLRVAAYRL
jgi:hypothetical protein